MNSQASETGTIHQPTHLGVAPVRVYEELAENGILYEFLQNLMPDALKKDEDFRKEMYDILLRASPDVIPELEVALLYELSDALTYFTTIITQWKK